MSELVVMPKADWQDALDKVRALTHSSAPIKSGDLASILDPLRAVGDQFEAVAAGTIVAASDVSSGGVLSIAHGLGVRPNFFVFFADELVTDVDTEVRALNFAAAAYMVEGATTTCGILGFGYGFSRVTDVSRLFVQKDSSTWQGSEYRFLSDVFTTEAIKISPDKGSKPITAGRVFHWLCGATRNR